MPRFGSTEVTRNDRRFKHQVDLIELTCPADDPASHIAYDSMRRKDDAGVFTLGAAVV